MHIYSILNLCFTRVKMTLVKHNGYFSVCIIVCSLYHSLYKGGIIMLMYSVFIAIFGKCSKQLKLYPF